LIITGVRNSISDIDTDGIAKPSVFSFSPKNYLNLLGYRFINPTGVRAAY